MEGENEKKGTRYFFDLSEVARYYFRKKDPNRKPNLNIRMMHGINKIAIVMFLGSIIYLIIKKLILS